MDSNERDYYGSDSNINLYNSMSKNIPNLNEIHFYNGESSDDDNSEKQNGLPAKKTKGRVKIKMEFIDNKLRRYTTFSKRKTGIMKKAYELSTLTGTQVMLLVASETGHVYTFATRKLQPMITSESGKALIQTCLNSPDNPPCQASTSSVVGPTPISSSSGGPSASSLAPKRDQSVIATATYGDDYDADCKVSTLYFGAAAPENDRRADHGYLDDDTDGDENPFDPPSSNRSRVSYGPRDPRGQPCPKVARYSDYPPTMANDSINEYTVLNDNDHALLGGEEAAFCHFPPVVNQEALNKVGDGDPLQVDALLSAPGHHLDPSSLSLENPYPHPTPNCSVIKNSYGKRGTPLASRRLLPNPAIHQGPTRTHSGASVNAIADAISMKAAAANQPNQAGAHFQGSHLDDRTNYGPGMTAGAAHVLEGVGPQPDLIPNNTVTLHVAPGNNGAAHNNLVIKLTNNSNPHHQSDPKTSSIPPEALSTKDGNIILNLSHFLPSNGRIILPTAKPPFKGPNEGTQPTVQSGSLEQRDPMYLATT